MLNKKNKKPEFFNHLNKFSKAHENYLINLADKCTKFLEYPHVADVLPIFSCVKKYVNDFLEPKDFILINNFVHSNYF